jgi:hypothetical protein
LFEKVVAPPKWLAWGNEKINCGAAAPPNASRVRKFQKAVARSDASVKFLSMFSSNKAGTVVFKTLLTTASVMTASHTTDFPRPSIQFTAVGFLSAQKLPDPGQKFGIKQKAQHSKKQKVTNELGTKSLQNSKQG